MVALRARKLTGRIHEYRTILLVGGFLIEFELILSSDYAI